jgi:hypothetical protein
MVDEARERCCETRLRSASMDLEVFSLHVAELRRVGLLDAEHYAEVFKHIAVIQHEVSDALDCAAGELAAWHRLAAEVSK